jgi:alpha-galactosidase
MGPGGIFRAARTIPVMDALAHDMRDCCPDALLLNYVNPMAMVCNALQDAGIRSVGLCHGVQTTLDLIAGYTDVPKAEIDFLCAGINHMAWFLRLSTTVATCIRCCVSAWKNRRITRGKRCAGKFSGTPAT